MFDDLNDLLAALAVAELDKRQIGGGTIALALVGVAKRMHLTGELTPEVRRFVWSVCGELGLPAVLDLPEPGWKRRNGKHVTTVMELPSIDANCPQCDGYRQRKLINRGSENEILCSIA